jgi:3-methyladenine DNA glycosylase AlkD
MKVTGIQKELTALGDPRTAISLQKFFKTGPGEYGDGDLFRGIRVPVIRKLAKEHQSLTLAETEELLCSCYHEDRLFALLILIHGYSKNDEAHRAEVYDLYLRNARFINNWDLVDVSAPHIVGAFLRDKDRSVLYDLAGSSDLWKRRIAIMATFHFIKSGQESDTLKIAQMLLSDGEDLIHKAVGWMLREVGKRNLSAEERFLENHYKKMPRVMLRYAIEKFPESERRRYLRGEV